MSASENCICECGHTLAQHTEASILPCLQCGCSSFNCISCKPDISANDYQRLAMRTAGDTIDTENGLIIAALGLTGEAGEFADLIKKHKFHFHELDRDKAIKELGDVCWYIARACLALDTTLSEVMRGNIEKLKQRYPEGFTTERSLNRIE